MNPMKTFLGLLIVLSIALGVSGLWASPPQLGAEQQPLAQARQAMRRGDYSRAIALYHQTLAERPENARALRGLGKAYLLSRQFRLAIETYRSLLRHDPRDREAQIGMGETYNLLAQYAKAEGPLRQALRADAGDAEAAWALSRTYFYERRLLHAQRLLERIVAEHPGDYRLWESLGEVQLQQGRADAARGSLRRALDLNPKAQRAQLLLHNLDTPGTAEGPLKLDFHNYAYLLNDGVGNQILTLPQTLNLSYGSRWRSHLTTSYLRAAFRRASSEGVAGQEESGINPPAGSLSTLAVGIVSMTDSTELQVNDALTFTGTGGVAQYLGQGMTRSIYNVGLKFSPTYRLELSYSYGQQIVAPTEFAARLGLTQQGWSSRLSYSFTPTTTLDLTYYQDRLSDSNRFRGGSGEVRQVVWEGPFQLRVGYQLESLSFARSDLFHGYFSPKRFLANTGLVNLRGHKGRLHYNYDFDLGEETYTRPVLLNAAPLSFITQRHSNPRFIATLRNSYDLNPRWSFQFSALFFRSALSSGTGAYQAYAILFGLTRRF